MWEAQWEVGSGGYAAHGFVCMESEVVCGWLQHTSLLLIMVATVLYVKSVVWVRSVGSVGVLEYVLCCGLYQERIRRSD